MIKCNWNMNLIISDQGENEAADAGFVCTGLKYSANTALFPIIRMSEEQSSGTSQSESRAESTEEEPYGCRRAAVPEHCWAGICCEPQGGEVRWNGICSAPGGGRNPTEELRRQTHANPSARQLRSVQVRIVSIHGAGAALAL